MAEPVDTLGRTVDAQVGIVVRLIRVVRALLVVHLDAAKAEASRDLARVVTGIALLVSAAIFVAVALFLVDVAAVVLLERYALFTLPISLAAVAGANVVVAIVCGLVGRARLRAPMLQDTRVLARKTALILTEG